MKLRLLIIGLLLLCVTQVHGQQLPLSVLSQSGATTGQVPQWSGTAWTPATVSGGSGVTSVSGPSFLTWATPTTTPTATVNSQSAYYVLWNSSGSSAVPTFSLLTAAGIPNIAESQVTNLTTDLAAKQATLTFTLPLLNTANTISVNAATTSAVGVSQFETSSTDTTSTHAVTANDTRLSDSRAPTGTAGGDLSGSYPNPNVANINGVALGSTTATSGNLMIGQGSSWLTEPMSGDGTITLAGVLAITKVNGVGYPSSVTTGWTLIDNGNGVTSMQEPWLGSCNLCSTSNIASLSGTSVTVDGTTAASGFYVLCTGQTTPSQNGPWLIPSSGPWTRPSWFRTTAVYGVLTARYIPVLAGTSNAGIWQITNTTGITVDTTAITLTKLLNSTIPVTSVTSGNFSPLFNVTVATGTTTPAFSFAAINASADSWFGNATGSGAAAAFNTSAFPAIMGGTGLASFAVGDILYAPTTTTIGKLSDVATGSVLASGGVGVAPSYIAPGGDISGAIGAITVGKLLNRPLNAATSLAGQQYEDDGTNQKVIYKHNLQSVAAVATSNVVLVGSPSLLSNATQTGTTSLALTSFTCSNTNFVTLYIYSASGAGTVSSVSTPTNLTLTRIASDYTNSSTISIWSGIASGAVSGTVTVTMTGYSFGPGSNATLTSYSGITGIDAVGSGNHVAGPSNITASVTTGANNTYVFLAGYSPSSTPLTAGTGYTLDANATSGTNAWGIEHATSVTASSGTVVTPIMNNGSAAGTYARAFSVTIASPTSVVDGHSMADGEEADCTAQTTSSQNGPQVYHSTGWVRAVDYPTGKVVPNGLFTYCFGGSTYAGTLWGCTTTPAITVDTTSTAWSQIAGTRGSTPGVAIGTDTTAVSLTSGGTDTAGNITATGAVVGATGTLVVVTFGTAYSATPRAIQVTPTTSATALCQPYISASSATGFTISNATTSGTAASLGFNYTVSP